MVVLMALPGDAQFNRIISGISGGPVGPNINMVVSQVIKIVQDCINAADMPASVKGAIANGVSGTPLSATEGIVTVPSYNAASVYEGQSANLTLVFNKRKSYRTPPPRYKVPGTNIIVPMSGGMIKPYNNMFLEKALAEANMIHPLVMVTM